MPEYVSPCSYVATFRPATSATPSTCLALLQYCRSPTLRADSKSVAMDWTLASKPGACLPLLDLKFSGVITEGEVSEERCTAGWTPNDQQLQENIRAHGVATHQLVQAA